ncbi:MAG: pyruvate kinase [Candidatus Competibacteraceae bacterium]
MRECAADHSRDVGVLADLPRSQDSHSRFFAGGGSEEGDRFVLDASLAEDVGNVETVGITYKALPQDVQIGDTLLLDDGRIVLVVEDVLGSEVICQVWVGGELSNKKGINRQGGVIGTGVDRKGSAGYSHGGELGVDYLAISFPITRLMQEARELMQAAGGHAAIVAKIEQAEAVEAIEGNCRGQRCGNDCAWRSGSGEIGDMPDCPACRNASFRYPRHEPDIHYRR